MAFGFDAIEFGIGSLFDILGTGARVSAARQENEFRQEELTNQLNEEKIAANNRALQRQDQLAKVISSQEARIGAGGVAASSPSYRAIEENTFDEFAKDQRADNLSLSFKELQIGEEREQAREEEHYKVSNSLFSGAASLFDQNIWGSFGGSHSPHFNSNFGDTDGTQLPIPRSTYIG